MISIIQISACLGKKIKSGLLWAAKCKRIYIVFLTHFIVFKFFNNEQVFSFIIRIKAEPPTAQFCLFNVHPSMELVEEEK